MYGVRISAHSRRRWADLCAGSGTVRSIADLYEAEGILADQGADTGSLGARRSEAMIHEASLNLDSEEGNRRLLRVYAEGVEEFGRTGYDPFGPNALSPEKKLTDSAKALVESLRRDGAQVSGDDRIVVPPGPPPPEASLPVTDYTRLDQPQVLEAHLARINRNVTSDPAAVIGSAKELIGSVCKFVLEDYGESYDRKDDMLTLYKKTAKALQLNAEAIPESARASEAAQRALRSMATAVQSLAELRNEIGLGHGQTRPSPALERHAKLAVSLARGLAEFLLDTWHVRRAS